MTTAYTSLLGLALPVTGELSGTWGDTVNTAITTLLDSAVAGTTSLTTDADVTLTTTTGAANQARQAILLWTAGGSTTRNITAPAQSKAYFVINKTSSTQSIVIRGAGPTTGVTVLAGTQSLVVWDGADFVEVASGNVDGPATATDNAVARFDGTTGKLIQNSVVTIADTSGNMAGVGTLGVGAITTSGALTYGGVALSNSVTGTGSMVLSNSPTLVTPALGIPSSGTVTNLTGTASININGTVGATTASTGAFTTLTTSSTVTLSGGTANGVAYLDGSKVLTTGSALTFDGTVLTSTTSAATAGNFKASSSTAQVFNVTASNDANTTIGLGVFGSAASTFGMLTAGQPLLGTAASDLNIYSSNASGVIKFGVGATPTEQMRLTSTGLGIGTSSPGAALHVAGAISSSPTGSGLLAGLNGTYGQAKLYGSAGGILDFGASGADGKGRILYDNISNYMSFGTTNAAEQMRLTSTGLGIGTSSPGAKLTVAAAEAIRMANASPYLSFYNGAQSTRFGYIQHNGTNFSLVNEQAGSLEVYTNNTVRATLDSSGNLGLGVTPSAGWSGYKAIQVGTGASFGGYADDVLAFVGSNCYNDNTNWRYLANGNAAARYQQSAGVHQWYTAPSGTAGNAISFSQAMTLDASGNLIVGNTEASAVGTTGGVVLVPDAGASYTLTGHKNGTASGTAYAFYFYNGSAIGSITQSGTTAVLYNVTSDQRLKENIVNAPEFGSVIDSIKVRSYDWKSDGSHQRAGFVAQELVTVAPEAVHQPTDPEEMMAVDYSKLVPMLVKEIQSLRQRLAAAGI